MVYDFEIRWEEATSVCEFFVTARKSVLFCFGSTGTGKTTLIRNLLFNKNVAIPKNLLIPDVGKKVYVNAFRTRKNTRFAEQVSNYRPQKKTNKFVFVLDEADKLTDSRQAEELNSLLSLAVEKKKLKLILISNDATFLRKKLAKTNLSETRVSFLPFRPFTKQQIKGFLLRSGGEEKAVERVAKTVYMKKADLRSAVALLAETSEIQRKPKSPLEGLPRTAKAVYEKMVRSGTKSFEKKALLSELCEQDAEALEVLQDFGLLQTIKEGKKTFLNLT